MMERIDASKSWPRSPFIGKGTSKIQVGNATCFCPASRQLEHAT
jgi:hypothetical protein